MVEGAREARRFSEWTVQGDRVDLSLARGLELEGTFPQGTPDPVEDEESLPGLAQTRELAPERLDHLFELGLVRGHRDDDRHVGGHLGHGLGCRLADRFRRGLRLVDDGIDGGLRGGLDSLVRHTMALWLSGSLGRPSTLTTSSASRPSMRK